MGQFRKQPLEECLSTLEAVGECLLALETDYDRARAANETLRRLFASMVEQQVDYIKNSSWVPPAERDGDKTSCEEASEEFRKPKSCEKTNTWCLVRYERGGEGLLRKGVVEDTLRKLTYD